MKKLHFNLLLLSVAGLLIGGCKTSTSPSNSSITTPGAGSYFVNVSQSKDTMGMITSSDTSTDNVVQTGLAFSGKTNVMEVITTNSDGSHDTNYFHYESNGDVSVYAASSSTGFGTLPTNNGWITIPFASQGTTTSSSDTTIDGYPFHVNFTVAGAGSGSVTIKGKSFSTENAKMTIAMSGSVFGQAINMSTATTLQFAPSLGYVVATNTPGTRNPITGTMQPSNQSMTIDYSLK